MKQALILFSGSIYSEVIRKNILSDSGSRRNLFEIMIEKSLKEVIKAAEEIQFDIIISTENYSLTAADQRDFKREDIRYIYQSGKNFGERFLKSINEVCNSGYDNFVVIGNDTPDLSAVLIVDAFRKLRNSDVVIGPSEDGGFYLFGCNKNSDKIFKDIPWLTSGVFTKLRNNVERLGYNYELLPVLADIDSHSDLIKWIRKTHYNPELVNLILQFVLLRLKYVYNYNQSCYIKPQLSLQIWQIPPPSN